MFTPMRLRQFLPAALCLAGAPSAARAGECRVLEVDYLPAQGANPDLTLRMPLSVVAWLETPSGQFVDTIYITQQVGTYGLGNRPGRFDFNSGPDWPYGRRITTFPVWAHRHGMQWDQVIFQDTNDDGLSHASSISSREKHYFRPMLRSEPSWDATTHASVFGPYTDKGKFGTAKSLYPPRQDVMKTNEDSPSVTMYDALNPFDSVSQASAPSGARATFSWAAPMDLAAGVLLNRCQPVNIPGIENERLLADRICAGAQRKPDMGVMQIVGRTDADVADTLALPAAAV